MSDSSMSSDAVYSVKPRAPPTSTKASASASATRSRRLKLIRRTRDEAVTEPVHVLDRVIAAGPGQLAAQYVHVAAQRVAGFLLPAPDFGFDFLPAEHAVGLRHHQLQNADALRRQPRLLAAETRRQAGRVERQVAEAQRPGGHAARAALVQRQDTRRDFLERERLDEIVIGPQLEPAQLVLQGIARRPHQ